MLLPQALLSYLAHEVVPSHISKKIDESALDLNSVGFDRWGLQPDYLKAFIGLFWPLYKHYFKVKVYGAQHIPNGKVLLVSNHSGQIPIDAVLITIALLDQSGNPRLSRAMIEYWVPSLPFIGDLFTRCGQIIGDPSNFMDLLAHKQAILVFPEGVRGIGKPFKDRYQLQRFGTGFCRLAIEGKAPIVPVAVVGAEEIYPSLGNVTFLAKLLKMPYFPLTPFFPWLGVGGTIPLPIPIDIWFGEPQKIKARADCEDEAIAENVNEIRSAIQGLIDQGLAKRSGYWKHRRKIL